MTEYQHFARQWKSIFKVWFHSEKGSYKYAVPSSSDLSGFVFRDTTPVSADQVLLLCLSFLQLVLKNKYKKGKSSSCTFSCGYRLSGKSLPVVQSGLVWTASEALAVSLCWPVEMLDARAKESSVTPRRAFHGQLSVQNLFHPREPNLPTKEQSGAYCCRGVGALLHRRTCNTETRPLLPYKSHPDWAQQMPAMSQLMGRVV